jgi:hypothetical protein
MPNFETWDRATLDRFAYECYEKLQEQDDRIQQLQCDLQDAIAAYRELITQPQTALSQPYGDAPAP